MPKFRYSLDSGTSWVVVDASLPYNIPSTAEQNVIVEPIGTAVSNLGTIDGDFLSLTYDAAEPAADVAAFTNIAGTFYWAVTASITPPSAAAIIAGTGFVDAGNAATVPGAFAFTLPTLSGAPDLFLHAVVNGTAQTNIATVRVYIGTESAYAVISGTTGSPTVHDYTDGDGTWRAYEFTANGSFTVSTAGGLEYELVAGGGGGGGGSAYVAAGGGGAGGVLLGTTTLTPGVYSVVVGAGGAGGSTGNSGRSVNGADSTALGLTALGGGGGGVQTGVVNLGLAGGSGGGARGISSIGGLGTSGQGYNGGGGQANGGGGGGGAGGLGGNGSTNVGGNGGVGIASVITGTSRNIAGGGAASGGASTGAPGTASFGGGAAASTNVNTNTAGGAGTAAGAGGGAATGTGAGGSGYRGHFILRVQV